MRRSALIACVIALVLGAGRSALADVPLQAGAQGGIECLDHCTQRAFAGGINGFWKPGRVAAIGAVFEYVNTAALGPTNTLRFGFGVRAYFSRDGLFEPYAGLAFGPAWFRGTTASGCTLDAEAYGQVAAGIDVRINRFLFAGAALSATGQGYSKSCPATIAPVDRDDEGWNTGPTYGFFATVRAL